MDLFNYLLTPPDFSFDTKFENRSIAKKNGFPEKLGKVEDSYLLYWDTFS